MAYNRVSPGMYKNAQTGKIVQSAQNPGRMPAPQQTPGRPAVPPMHGRPPMTPPGQFNKLPQAMPSQAQQAAGAAYGQVASNFGQMFPNQQQPSALQTSSGMLNYPGRGSMEDYSPQTRFPGVQSDQASAPFMGGPQYGGPGSMGASIDPNFNPQNWGQMQNQQLQQQQGQTGPVLNAKQVFGQLQPGGID